MWRLFQPLAYLRIRHPEKTIFDWALPLILAIAAAAAWLCAGVRTQVLVQNTGILPQIQSLLAILTGFFIAALAAVATFNGEGMDEPMVGKTPATLRSRGAGGEIEILSRRRFLCLLFGFLAFLALSLYFSGVFVIALHQQIDALFVALLDDYSLIRDGIYLVAWAVYAFLLAQLMVNTLLGLYYLTERIHRPTGRHVVGKPTKPDNDRPQIG